ncbi:myb-like protein X [Neodiprion pinetum]|uniref:myb-like protein X n=1 Tax=Neodiprion pinetum TaxID=441929 RepID=UPI001EE00AFE|nr:uncharacterized protein LOC124214359 [Neodiprion pinetum]
MNPSSNLKVRTKCNQWKILPIDSKISKLPAPKINRPLPRSDSVPTRKSADETFRPKTKTTVEPDKNAISTRTRSKARTTTGKRQALSEDSYDDESSEPPAYRRQRSVLSNLGLEQPTTSQGTQQPEQSDIQTDARTDDDNESDSEPENITVKLKSPHDKDSESDDDVFLQAEASHKAKLSIDPEELRKSFDLFNKSLRERSNLNPKELQDSFERFDKTLHERCLLDNSSNSDTDEIEIPGHISEGEELDETIREALDENDETDDDELNNKIERFLEKVKRNQGNDSEAGQINTDQTNLNESVVSRPLQKSALPTPIITPRSMRRGTFQ